MSLFVESLPYTFYAYLSILFSLFLALTGIRFGPMAVAERRAEETGALLKPGAVPMISDELAGLQPVEGARNRALDFFVPLLVMAGMIFLSLFITGEGNLMKGSGSLAVLWSVGTGIAAAIVLYALPIGGRPVLGFRKSLDLVVQGCAGLTPVTILIVPAFALGQVARALGMGPYLASVIGLDISPWWLPALIFLIGCGISFATGSSWATFAVMIPVALPAAAGVGVPAELALGAVLSGGVFGDHASPLSDTTIISAMASASDLVDHVETQLPYALLVAVLSFVGYLICGLVLT